MTAAIRESWSTFGPMLREVLWSIVGVLLMCEVFAYLDKIGI